MALLLVAPLVQDALADLGGPGDPARAGAGVALLGLLVAGYLTLVRAGGPLSVSAADAAWLLLSPLPRRRVLRRSVVILCGVAVVAGLGLGVGLIAVLGAPDQTMLRLAAALTLGLAVTVGGTATAVLAQTSGSWDNGLRVVILAVAAVAVLAVLDGGAAAGRMAQEVPALPGVALAVGCAVAAALVAWLAWVRLERVHARELLAASTRMNQVATATTVLDPGALTWIAEDTHWRGRALRSRPWPGLPAAFALAWHDWRRLGRRPGRLALLAVSAALPALAARASGSTTITVALTAAGALLAAASCTAGARRDAGDPALLRLTGVGPLAASAARAVLPALVGGGWLALAFLGLNAVGDLPGAPVTLALLALATAPALAAGALRMAGRAPVDHAMPVVNTPFGALPTGPVVWATTGADLASVGGLPAFLVLLSPSVPLERALLAQTVVGAVALALYLSRKRAR